MKDEMGEACRIYGEDEKCMQHLVGIVEGKRPF
jgi:hypothetical protein